MGEEVSARVFSREDRQRYRTKVKRCLDVFARMLAESRFDDDRRSVGLEIELNLTDAAGDPAMLNSEVLERIADEDFQTELAQFNVEINIPRACSPGRCSPSSSATSAPTSTTPRSAPARSARTW